MRTKSQMLRQAYAHRRIKAIHSMLPHMPVNILKRHIFNRLNEERKKMMLKKPEPKTHLHRERIDTFTIEQVQEWVNNPHYFKRGKSYVKINGIKISLRRTSPMLSIGVVCKHCGKIGTKFCLEKTLSGSYHLDLFSDDDTMMTIDHIIPRSKGGENDVSNYQCLCYTCNYKKGNSHCH